MILTIPQIATSIKKNLRKSTYFLPPPSDWLLRILEDIDIKTLTAWYFSRERLSAVCHPMSAIQAQTNVRPL
jgi:hypothetical protein